MSTKEKAAETDEAEAKGGKKKLILVLLVVVLAAAGAAYFFLFSGESAAAEEPVSSGTYLVLDPVAVNLAGGGYLKIGLSLDTGSSVASAEPGKRKKYAAPAPARISTSRIRISFFLPPLAAVSSVSAAFSLVLMA